MKSLEINKFLELFEQAPSTTEYSDIPEEKMADFHIFMRLMEARSPEDIEDISFDTVLNFLNHMLEYAQYLDTENQHIDKILRNFSKIRSQHIKRVL